jgi:hypothetical protein
MHRGARALIAEELEAWKAVGAESSIASAASNFADIEFQWGDARAALRLAGDARGEPLAQLDAAARVAGCRHIVMRAYAARPARRPGSSPGGSSLVSRNSARRRISNAAFTSA